MRVRSLLVVLLPLMLAPVAARAAEKLPKLVVLGIKPIDGSTKKTTESLTEILTTELAKTGRFEVLSESELGSLLGFDKQKQILNCSDASCLAELGGALGCDYLLLGALGQVGSQVSLDMKLADVKRSKIVGREGTQVRNADELLGAGRMILRNLLAQLPGGSPPAAVASAGVEVQNESTGPGAKPYIVMGVGGAALVSGVILTGVTLANKDSYRYKDADTRASVGFVLGGVGLAAVATGAIWAIVGSSSAESAPSTTVGIAPAAGGAAICASGSF